MNKGKRFNISKEKFMFKSKIYILSFVVLFMSSFINYLTAQETETKSTKDPLNEVEEKKDEKGLTKDKVLENLAKLRVDVQLKNEGYRYNNLDFHDVDESSDQAIKDTDDNTAFAYSKLGVDLNYAVSEALNFDLGLSKQGLWGNDQFGNVSDKGDVLYFETLYMEWTPLKMKTLTAKLLVGRQYFNIGGAFTDYYYSDIIDGVLIDLNLNTAGSIKLIPFDMFVASNRPDQANFARWIGQNHESAIVGMDGDTNTYRMGLVYEFDQLMQKALAFRVFGFYADIGGIGSGSDITYNGDLGNYADGDWLTMFGGRVSFDKDLSPDLNIKAFGDFAYSYGIDRKEEVLLDVDIKGMAFGVGAKATYKEKSYVQADFFFAEGGKYSANGQQYNHGFVSFKGGQIGGVCMNQFAGMHPSAYIGSYGINDTPHNIDRKSGTMYFHFGGAYTLPKPEVSLIADFYMYWDTNKTNLEMADLDDGTIDPPFGYSRDEYYAEERFGKALGMEIDFKANYNYENFLDVYIGFGVFLPGDFYKIEIAKVAGSQLGGEEMFWATYLGTDLHF